MLPDRHPAVLAARRGSWGVLETSLGRYGASYERLRIYPPDTTYEERRLWAMLRVWPILGFIGGFGMVLLAYPLVGVGLAIVLGALLWLIPLAWLWVANRPFLTRIHEEFALHHTEDSPAEDLAELDRLSRVLASAEEARRSGALTDGEFRVIWADAYSRVGIRSHAGG